jgi:ABC-2 type transport system ATP-binding protein
MKHVVEVKNLVKRYAKADTNAVDEISFTINEGEFFAFLGPNGAGKTTTISILSTILQKTSGTVTVGGYDLDKNQSEIRRSVGIIFQNPSLDRNLTAEENVRFHAILYGLYPFRPSFSLMPKAYQTKVHELAEILDIDKDMFKPIGSFSGGMKRKLEIVRSLMHEPKVLFLDEPTSGLDPISRKNLWSYLRDVRKKQHTTILLTTHYLEEAEEADNVCIINHGKIVSRGTPLDLKRDLIERYVYLETRDTQALRNELKELDMKFEQNGGFKVFLKDMTVYKLLKSLDTEITLVHTHNPTLEDAYLEIIDKTDK